MFLTFFKIGAFTIGGGMAMLPIIEREFTVKNRWITPEEIVDIFAVSQATPGVIAINSSFFVGYKLGGVIGALVAAAGVILPSFIIILVVATLLTNIGENIWLKKAFAGVRAGVTALIAISALKLAKTVIKDLFTLVLGVTSALALIIFGLPAQYAILAGAAAGVINMLVRNLRRAQKGGEGGC